MHIILPVVVSGSRRLPSSASAISFVDLSRWNHKNQQQQQPKPMQNPHIHIKNWKSFSTTKISSHPPFSNQDEIRRHRSRLQIGLQDAGDDGIGGDATPRITVLLTTALRNGMRQFDVPPSFGEYRNITDGEGKNIDFSVSPSSLAVESSSSVDIGGGVGSNCWNANRKSEMQTASALQLALDGLLSKEEKQEDETRSKNDKSQEIDIVTLTSRLGYRSAIVNNNSNITSAEVTNDTRTARTSIDWQEQENKFVGDAQVGILFAGEDGTTRLIDNNDSTSQPSVAIVHNLSSEYVLHSLRTSPLVQWRQRQSTPPQSSLLKKSPKIRLVSLAHNPETQTAAYLIQQQQNTAKNVNNSALLTQARSHMKQALTSAFIGYEIAVKEDLIDGYGVDSNGLSLPSHHNMHLCWKDVLECAVNAYVQVHGDHISKGSSMADDVAGSGTTAGRSSLKILRLPGNLLETRGLTIADEIRTFFTSNYPADVKNLADGDDTNDDHRGSSTLRKLHQSRHILPTSVDVYATRPTWAIPHGDGGAESNARNDGKSRDMNGKNLDATRPVLLNDYQLMEDVEESSSSSDAGTDPRNATTLSSTTPLPIWTNEYYNKYGLRPTTYQSILNATLSHFDADSILEASRSRSLTVEERETLDGCKLLRDMIHDLDTSLDDLKSFAAYEEYLMKVAVPLIYGSFEGLDEESASSLQSFLRVHGMAARLVVARWTRELLLVGRRRKRGNKDPKMIGNSAHDDHDLAWETNKDEEKKMLQTWKSLGFGSGDILSKSLGYEIPEEIPLQEFAVRHLMENAALSGVVLDCSSPEDILNAVRAVESDYSY